MNDIADTHGQFALGEQVLGAFRHLDFFGHVHLRAHDQLPAPEFGREAHAAFVMAELPVLPGCDAQGDLPLPELLVDEPGEKRRQALPVLRMHMLQQGFHGGEMFHEGRSVKGTEGLLLDVVDP